MIHHPAPVFAMSFLPDAVVLEHRRGQNWQPLGKAKFAGGNIGPKLNALRGNAGLDPAEPDTILVIPDDQILYARLTVSPGSDVTDTVARMLEGMTPFTADKLAFDWCPDKDGKTDSLRVAAVARKTLEEAEEFALAQGFSPIGFEGRPGDDRFAGQPDFGPSHHARQRRNPVPFSKPNLRMAGINSDRIDIDDPEDTSQEHGLPQAAMHGITRIIPHYQAGLSPDKDDAVQSFEAKGASGSTGNHAKGIDAPEPSLAVIRHHQPYPEPSVDELSPRAKAIHTRAAEILEIRQKKATATEETSPSHKSLGFMGIRGMGRLLPGSLTALVVLLFAAMVAAWWFLGGPSNTLEIAAPTETVTDANTHKVPTIAEINTAVLEALADTSDDGADDPTLTDTPVLLPPAAEDLPAPFDEASFPTHDSVSARLVRTTTGSTAQSQALNGAGSLNEATLPVTDQRTTPQNSNLSSLRPPPRPEWHSSVDPVSESSAGEEAGPIPQAAPEGIETKLQSSRRPATRPGDGVFLEEGSAAGDSVLPLTAAERTFLNQLLRDLRTAQAGAQGLSEQERKAVFRLAQIRPVHRPLDVSRISENAVRNTQSAARSGTESGALKTSRRPVPRAAASSTPDKAAANNGDDRRKAGLARSARPVTRPASIGAGGGGTGPSLAKGAIESAIAAAVESSSAKPGAVALTALTSSDVPPRRSEAIRSAAQAAPSADDLRSAAKAQEAELAAQRRIDDELQAQVEARIRARAAADARAEAQARAAAEARARAQAEAEARAAAARQQAYSPPEAENEPELNSTGSRGRTPATVAAAATIKDGISLNRTQIIGTIGAGKASRALVRLSNGRVLTLRLGDRINGGTITEIGNSRIVYSEGGRSKQLSVLNGK